ncbi:MAG: hypothetical protein R3D00_23860 [Bacteroidia bacterium]
MLNKLKGKPIWYIAWAISVAICAVYYLVKFFFFEVSPADRLVEVYVFASVLIDLFVLPKTAAR